MDEKIKKSEEELGAKLSGQGEEAIEKITKLEK